MKTTASRVYFGSTALGEEHGIYMAPFYRGQLGRVVRVSSSARPSFILLHPHQNTLYATEAANGPYRPGGAGQLSAYRIEASGALTTRCTQSSGGIGPCHLSLSPAATHLLCANYRSGSCALLPIAADGALEPPCAIEQHAGSGPNTQRQQRAHTHSFYCDPSGSIALAADLGSDQIVLYRVAAERLTRAGAIAARPGAGPRHLAFHPNGAMVYASMELNGTVAVYRYKDQTLQEVQVCSTLPPYFEGSNTVSEVCVTPDGRFLYVGNRGFDHLAVFAIDPVLGLLSARGYASTRGAHPRHFNIDPSGRFLIAANMHSHRVVVFEIDRTTGRLRTTGSEIEVPSPSCVQFQS